MPNPLELVMHTATVQVLQSCIRAKNTREQGQAPFLSPFPCQTLNRDAPALISLLLLTALHKSKAFPIYSSPFQAPLSSHLLSLAESSLNNSLQAPGI